MVNKDYIIQVLNIGGWISCQTEGQYVVFSSDVRTVDGFEVKIWHVDGAEDITFYLQSFKPDGSPLQAWSEVQLPVPAQPNAYLSQCIRWIVKKILTTPSKKNNE